jgi:hypothetical protein
MARRLATAGDRRHRQRAPTWDRIAIREVPMEELIRSNDPVLIATVEALLGGADIAHFVADRHMSVLEGSIGIFARRVLVDGDDAARARRLLIDAGLGAELRDPP